MWRKGIDMGALTGLKVLDFSTLLPGPYATLVMADMGAEVISVAAPGRWDILTEWPPVIEGTEGAGIAESTGSSAKPAGGVTAVSAWIGRNKKTIWLDLKTELGVEAVKRLVRDEGYDIILEQFRPGVMARLGLGYDDLKELNPRLIYCSLTGYGQTGPMAMRAGHDINYLSRSGNMNQAGRQETGPVLTNVQIADVAAGSMNSIISILAAVNYRHETGRGQYIDVAMMDGVVPFNGMDGAAFLGGGEMPGRDLRLDDPETKKAVRKAFASRTMKEWCEIFAGLDACVEPVLTLEEAQKDEQIRQRNMMPQVSLPADAYGAALAKGGKSEDHVPVSVQQLGCPLKLSECPPEYRHAGYPTGYHTREILKQLGFNEKEIAEATE